MSSATLIEPVLVGLRRAVLLVPKRLPDHLTQPQIEAILAHEFCHLRRRDNLTAAIHMLVEALFWFYPLIWWIGARLIMERERACDEAVVGAGHDREVYARGILESCRLYLQSPLACVAGASGSNLKKRVEMIMTASPSRPLGLAAKAFLVGVGVCALASPVAAGLLGAPGSLMRAPQSFATPTTAESAAAPGPSTADVERLREEQQKPRQVVPFDPPKFDRYVGYYQLTPNYVFKVTRDGDKFFAQLTGQGTVEWYPESDTKFFATVVAAQISFVTDAQGNATELVLHQNGLEQHAKRIDEATATNIESTIARRIEGKTPSPGTEAFVRKWLASVEAGQPDYNEMTPELAQAARTQWPGTREIIKAFGALKDVRFIRVDPQGIDIYEADFQNGKGEVSIAPLTADGKVGGLFLRNFDTPATDPAIARRIASNIPSPGTEASIRRWLASVEAGQPNYDEMAPELAEAARAQWPKISERIKPFGALKTIKFLRVNPQGYDVYEADFENNRIEVTIAPLRADGKVATRYWTLLP